MRQKTEYVYWDEVPLGAAVEVEGFSTFEYTKLDGPRGTLAYRDKFFPNSLNPDKHRYRIVSVVKAEPLKPYFTGFKNRRFY